ncbi:GGDEF domain-containing protein [Planctobacterium marinum]|uniref:GGDEF domain-containing protein n=1 Tax=Planctobacterium marinum TaxID=1631968 RepID=UPI0030C6EBB5
MIEGILFVVPTVMALFMASLLFFVSRTAKKFDSIFDEQPALWWAAGFLLLGCAWLQASLLAINGQTPGPLLTFINNIIYSAPTFLWPYGVWKRNRMGFAWHWFLSLVAIQVISLFSYTFVDGDYASRIILIHGIGALMALLTIAAIVRYPQTRYGDRLLILGFSLYLAYNLLTALVFVSNPSNSLFDGAGQAAELLTRLAPLAYVLLGVCFLGVMLLDVIQELSDKSRHDYLTGLYNRFGFELAYEDALDKAERIDTKGMVLVMVDLDKFKAINDKHGHSIGDRALTWFSHLLKTSCRKSDVVGRLGGDEFVILMWDCELTQCQEFLQRFSRRCERSPVPGLSFPIFVRASFGTCRVTKGIPLDETIALADKDLYTAKPAEQ